MEWRENPSQHDTFIEDLSPTPPGLIISGSASVKLNRPRTGVVLFHSKTHEWGMVSTATCECDAREQKAEHVITFGPIYHHPNRTRALSDVDKSLVTRLMKTCSAI